jgi:hypothetical protein
VNFFLLYPSILGAVVGGLVARQEAWAIGKLFFLGLGLGILIWGAYYTWPPVASLLCQGLNPNLIYLGLAILHIFIFAAIAFWPED